MNLSKFFIDRPIFAGVLSVLIFLAVLVLAPIVPTLYQSFLDRPLYEAGGVLSLDNYVRLFTEAGFGKVALNTIYLAGLTTLLTLLLAVPISRLIGDAGASIISRVMGMILVALAVHTILSAFATWLGLLAGTAAKVAIAFLMVGVFVGALLI